MASDLFKRHDHAKLYSKFRPSPPEQFVDFIVNYLKEKLSYPFKTAVDVGCGTGQSTVILAPHFEKVVGTDVSEAQILCAQKDRKLPNVTYEVADANCKLPFEDASVDLVASCEAIHWFDLDKLYSEVKRILRPGGAIAAYGYWVPLPYVPDDEETTAVMRKIVNEDLRRGHLGKYWSDVAGIVSSVENLYVDLPFPFKDVKRLDVVKKSESTLADYIRYISTWSGYQKFFEANPEEAQSVLRDVEKQLQDILDPGKDSEETEVKLKSDHFLLIGRC